jgi:hypothetical protein
MAEKTDGCAQASCGCPAPAGGDDGSDYGVGKKTTLRPGAAAGTRSAGRKWLPGRRSSSMGRWQQTRRRPQVLFIRLIPGHAANGVWGP